jgi:hypothetical protein
MFRELVMSIIELLEKFAKSDLNFTDFLTANNLQLDSIIALAHSEYDLFKKK